MDLIDRIAPHGAIWVCGACGKTSQDQFGIEGQHSVGWDESCMLNAVLCHLAKNEAGSWVAFPQDKGEEDNGTPHSEN